jgi:hypothetical protein
MGQHRDDVIQIVLQMELHMGTVTRQNETMVLMAEHWVPRLLLALGGAILSAFGPSVVPDPYEPLLVAFGFLLVIVALFWPILERWPGAFLRRNVFWRFRLRPPTALHTDCLSPAVSPPSIDLRSVPEPERGPLLAMLRDIEGFLAGPLAQHNRAASLINGLRKRSDHIGLGPALDEIQAFAGTTDVVTGEMNVLLDRHQSDINTHGLLLWEMPADLQRFRGRTQEIISRCRRAGDISGETISLVTSEPTGEANVALNDVIQKAAKAREQIRIMREALLTKS